MTARGWLDLTNAAGELKVGGRRIAFAGVDDSHLKRDRYDEVAGPGRPRRPTCASAWRTPPSRGCSTASPPTATTCCSAGTPTAASCGSRSTGRWSPTAASTGRGSAGCTAGPSRAPTARPAPGCTSRPGLGTSPYAPVRFACPPEATLLTLTAAGRLSPAAGTRAGGTLDSAAHLGVWRSLVARVVRDDEAAGSNPVTPTSASGAAVAAPESFRGCLGGRHARCGRRGGDRRAPRPPPPPSPPRSPPAGRPGSGRRGSRCRSWAEDAPHRCLYASDVSGVVEQYAWDRQTRRAPAGHRPAQRHADGHAQPRRRDHLVVRRQRRRRVRRLAHPAVRGRRGRRRRRRGRAAAYPAGLEVGRTLVAVGRSTDDGSELWLAPHGGAPRVIYRHPDPAGVDALTRDDELLVISHSEHGDPRYPALRVLRTADTTEDDAGRRRREVGRRGPRPARAGVRSAARRPPAAGRVTSGAAARSCWSGTSRPAPRPSSRSTCPAT